jgi:hypothetical protein
MVVDVVAAELDRLQERIAGRLRGQSRVPGSGSMCLGWSRLAQAMLTRP